MKKETRRIRCHKAIKIEGPVESSEGIPEVPLESSWPFCETSNTLLWPGGTQYIVVPAEV